MEEQNNINNVEEQSQNTSDNTSDESDSESNVKQLSRKERRAIAKNQKVSDSAVSTADNKQTFSKGLTGKIEKVFYHKYKLLLLVPMLLIVFSFIVIGVNYATTGDVVNRGITLKGGIEITITSEIADVTDVDLVSLENLIVSNFPDHDVRVREQTDFGSRTGVVVEANFDDQENINLLLDFLNKEFPDATRDEIQENLSTMGSVLSSDFFKVAVVALIIAFLFMAIVVFISFKTLAPSLAVVLAAFSDIVETLAIFNLIGGGLSIAGVAAFLMLIGYSVDTDILLSTRVLKGKAGTVFDKIKSAFSTGIKMSLTTLGVVIVGLIFSTSADLKQIFLILLIGLLVDLINTWFQNAGIIRYYIEKKGQVKNG